MLVSINLSIRWGRNKDFLYVVSGIGISLTETVNVKILTKMSSNIITFELSVIVGYIGTSILLYDSIFVTGTS